MQRQQLLRMRNIMSEKVKLKIEKLELGDEDN